MNRQEDHGHNSEGRQDIFSGGTRKGPPERHPIVLDELDVENPRNPSYFLREGKGQLDAHFDGLVQNQNSRHDPPRMGGTCIGTQRPWSCWFLASMDMVACGTRRKRSLAINWPETRQIP